MKLSIYIVLFSGIILSGCFTAGNKGKISQKGLEAECAGGCAVFKNDKSGCAEFHQSTSNSCANYFVTICKQTPSRCTNNESDDSSSGPLGVLNMPFIEDQEVLPGYGINWLQGVSDGACRQKL